MNRTANRLTGILLPLLLLVAVAVYAFILRCLHLLKPDHYYIISPDSHFFNWQAKLLLSSEGAPWTLHSGLTYPLAFIARSMSLVTGTSSDEALRLAGILVPPLIGIMSVLAIYLAVSRMYDRRVGLFSAFAWAIALNPVFFQAAGYVDRDGLSILLIIIGTSIFYFARHWNLMIGRLDIGWLAGGLAVLAVAALLYIQWLWLGVSIFLCILVAVVALEILIGFVSRLASSLMAEEDLLALPLVFLKRAPSAIAAAVRESNWKPLAMVLALALLVAAIVPGTISIQRLYAQGSQLVWDALSGTATVAELRGLTTSDLLTYGWLTVPVIVGLYVAVRIHRKADILWLGWLGVLFLTGLFAVRLFQYASPAVCVIAGLGLAALFDSGRARLSFSDLATAFWVAPRRLLTYARIALAVFLMLLLLLTSFSAYHLGSYRMVAATNAWEAALVYLRDNTPGDTVVVSWWQYGYWILDIAEREPVVDNGRHWEAIDRQIALVYVATEDSEAATIMQRYGADHLVFSTLEQSILPSITELALGETRSLTEDIGDSLYARAISGDWEFGGGLERVYPGPEDEEPEVVILRLA